MRAAQPAAARLKLNPTVETRSRIRDASAISLRIGLVNSMPPSAFGATDWQFSRLLTRASAPGRVSVLRFWIPQANTGVDRRDAVELGYHEIGELFHSKLDAVVLTGAGPNDGPLTAEPTWEPLCEVLEWSLANTVSILASCLAAHTATLLLDGVDRTRLEQKCFGVVGSQAWARNPLAAGLPTRIAVPHSHLNAVDTASLLASGYQPLLTSGSDWTAVTRTKRSCLLVLYQGHPEYERLTLLREFRRDWRRFQEGRLFSVPKAPEAYLAPWAGPRLDRLAAGAAAYGAERRGHDFPMAELSSACSDTWRDAARQLYTNWLEQVRERVAARASRQSGCSLA
ncbi:MAG: homoserine O-acetyltransferase/O-succinyltransferase family protein [Candidatus Dormibacteria bacterium]